MIRAVCGQGASCERIRISVFADLTRQHRLQPDNTLFSNSVADQGLGRAAAAT